MAATYDQLIVISNDQGFRNRVQLAMMTAAIAVYNEASSVTGHAARSAYAVDILRSNLIPYGVVLAVLSGSAIQTEATTTPPDYAIPDVDIQNQVSAIWNALAGV